LCSSQIACSFPNVTKLEVEFKEFPDLVPLLEMIGSQLRELSMKRSRYYEGPTLPQGRHYNLSHVLKLAPNLTSLTVDGLIISNVEPVPIKKEWVEDLTNFDLHNCHHLPRGTLLDVVSNAPKLKV